MKAVTYRQGNRRLPIEIRRWRDTNYMLDSLGNVYSSHALGRPKQASKRLHPVWHRTGRKKRAYYCLSVDGKRVQIQRSHLMLEAFGKLRPSPEAQGNHIDDRCHDDRAANLYWGDREQNLLDAEINRALRDPDRARYVYRLQESRVAVRHFLTGELCDLPECSCRGLAAWEAAGLAVNDQAAIDHARNGQLCGKDECFCDALADCLA